MNRAQISTDKHYRYVFTYDGLNRVTAADYSYANLAGGGAFAMVGDTPMAGDTTMASDTSWTSSDPEGVVALDVPGDPNVWQWLTTSRYDVSGITYDPNGNMKTLVRYGPSGSAIDNLTYVYGTNKGNRLTSITDAVGTTSETWDVQNGTAFTYDYNGNVLSAGVPYSISITAANVDEQNRPLSVTRSGTTTTYRYGSSGQRVYKKVGSGAAEYYIVDGDVVHGVFNAGGTVKY